MESQRADQLCLRKLSTTAAVSGRPVATPSQRLFPLYAPKNHLSRGGDARLNVGSSEFHKGEDVRECQCVEEMHGTRARALKRQT